MSGTDLPTCATVDGLPSFETTPSGPSPPAAFDPSSRPPADRGILLDAFPLDLFPAILFVLDPSCQAPFPPLPSILHQDPPPPCVVNGAMLPPIHPFPPLPRRKR